MTSPYLENQNRLSDVIAAIQVMSVYRFYKLDFEGWADRIAGDKSKAEYWKAIFVAHPEFFRLDQSRKKVSLVWRRSYPKNYDVDKLETISRQAFDNLAPADKMRISRSPLSNADIQTLISSAINLHNAALDTKKDKDWWKPALFGLLGVVIGYVIDVLSN